MDDLGRMFDPSPHGSQGTNAYVFTFIQPTKSQKITYREQQAIFYINDFNFNLIGLKLWINYLFVSFLFVCIFVWSYACLLVCLPVYFFVSLFSVCLLVYFSFDTYLWHLNKFIFRNFWELLWRRRTNSATDSFWTQSKKEVKR
jgi:hypothetical protein